MPVAGWCATPARAESGQRSQRRKQDSVRFSRFPSPQSSVLSARRATTSCLAAALFALIAFSLATTVSRAQRPDIDAPGEQVLTRGPVHEAFAGIVAFNPEPGVVVPKAPPEIIEEIPPEERPTGDNVTWIPGYWAWDDERSDFLWVSGTWRALPPGRQWRAGYWGKTAQGHQWISGYWADAAARETTYLPPPPATVEVGPNIAAPSIDYGWSPGCWVWYSGRYAWRPGYWALGRADWDWTPAHFVWSPRGYIFVDGFWDYPVQRRGLIFAPVYFESTVYARRGFFYSPSIVIDLGVFTDHLFLRPHYHHYYFGDYYAPSYHQGGFYASFSFQSGHRGYDPIYSHQHWSHRQDREWGHRIETSYEHRRDHEDARPPRTWAAQRSLNANAAEPKQNRAVVAARIDQLALQKNGPVRFQPVARDERQKLAQRGQEVQRARDQRRTVEENPGNATSRKPGAIAEPAKVQLAPSPIMAKPASQFGKNQAPPKAQQAPKPEPAARRPGAEKSNVPGEPRPLDGGKQKQPAPARSDPPSREKQILPEPIQRPKEPQATARKDSPRSVNGSETKAPRPPLQPARERPVAGEKGAARLVNREGQWKPPAPPNPVVVPQPKSP